VRCCVAVLVGAMRVELEEVHLLVTLGVGRHFCDSSRKKIGRRLPKG